MKKQIYIFAILLLLTICIVHPVTAKSELETGEYTLPISIQGLGEEDITQYFSQTANLQVSNEKIDVYLEVTKEFADISYVIDEKVAKMQVVGDAESRKFVTFSIASLTELEQPLNTIIQLLSGESHLFTIQFDTSKLPIIDEEPEVPENSGLKDGVYEVSYKTLKKDSEEESTMAEFFQNPALLKVKQNKQTFFLTVIKDPALIGYIALELNGVKTKMQLESKSETHYTFRIDVDDIEKVSTAYVYVDTPIYQHEYEFRFLIEALKMTDEDSIELPQKPDDKGPEENEPPAYDKNEEQNEQEQPEVKEKDSLQAEEAKEHNQTEKQVTTILEKYQLKAEPVKKAAITAIQDKLKFDRNADDEEIAAEKIEEAATTPLEATTTASKDESSNSAIREIIIYASLFLFSIVVLLYRYRKGVLFKRNKES